MRIPKLRPRWQDGLSSIRKAQVFKLCSSKLRKDFDERAYAFPDRLLGDDWTYLWLDVTC